MPKSEQTLASRLKNLFSLRKNYQVKPIGFKWRSHTLFLLVTVGAGMFSDLFLYAVIVPVLPFILRDHVGVPIDMLQRYTSDLLAVYAFATLLLCPVAGWVSDKLSSRRIPFLIGLLCLMFSTILLFTSNRIALLVLARILQGASSAFVWTVGMALAMDTVGAGNHGKTIGSLFSVASVSELFAPVVGGTLYEKSGELAVLALCMALLVIDLLMRLLMIEKSDAVRYVEVAKDTQDNGTGSTNDEQDEHSSRGEAATEETPLIANKDDRTEEEAKKYQIPEGQPAIFKAFPVLYPLVHESSIAAAYFVMFGQAFLLAAYEATVPTRASEMYGFDAMKAGLLFAPFAFICLIFGPITGWLVDRHGVKWPTLSGYVWLVPTLVLLRLPKPQPYPQQAFLWAGILAAMGFGVSLVGSGSAVEGARVVDLYEKHNKGFFGESGPYNQMCGLMSMFFNLGLSTGPILAGELKDRIGYGNMNAVLAGISAIMAITSLIWLGGRPAFFKRPHAKPGVMAA